MSENNRTTKLVFFGISDMGLKRTNNEDRFVVADLTRKMLGVEDNRQILSVIVLTVLLGVFLHSVSALPLSQLYGKTRKKSG